MSDYPTEERAGGLVFRVGERENESVIEYLLVTSNSNKYRWIIPAGHVEAGETAAQAALREVGEEAGVTAALIMPLGEIRYFWNHSGTQTLILTSFFLMEYRQTFAVNPEGRAVSFFGYPELLKLNLWDESRLFIQRAHQIATGYIQSRPYAAN